MKELRDRLDALRQQNDQHIQRNEDAMTAVASRERKMVDQQKRIWELEAAIAPLNAENKDLRERELEWARKLIDESITSRRAAEVSDAQLADALVLKSDAERELAAAAVMNDGYRKEIIALREEVGKLADTAWAKEFDLHCIETRLEDVTGERDRLRDQCHEEHHRINSLRSELAEKNDQLYGLRTQVEQAKGKRKHPGDVVDHSGKRLMGRR